MLVHPLIPRLYTSVSRGNSDRQPYEGFACIPYMSVGEPPHWADWRALQPRYITPYPRQERPPSFSKPRVFFEVKLGGEANQGLKHLTEQTKSEQSGCLKSTLESAYERRRSLQCPRMPSTPCHSVGHSSVPECPQLHGTGCLASSRVCGHARNSASARACSC
jgi:hypothetical protein